MKNETIKIWLRKNGFEYTSGQWRVEIDGGGMYLTNAEQEMNREGGRGFGRRSADAVVDCWHRDGQNKTRDFLKKMGVVGFYQGVEYLPVFVDEPTFPIHDFFIEGHLPEKNQEKIDRL